MAVVTGGSRGIGRAAVDCFAKLGANVVVLCDVDQHGPDLVRRDRDGGSYINLHTVRDERSPGVDAPVLN